ncbi:MULTISPECIES: hypothetical protein [unclassified Pseudomonas]|uniref:hypothetical protein n=1 Tax=unclassified Pseudomonas TaxID=196821 RepID=UPI001F576162|nr:MULTISPECIES: hypothetical protein [unclassified Pseudomonas]
MAEEQEINLTLNNISPFFQVLVFEKEKYNRKIFDEYLSKRIEKSSSKKKTISIEWSSSTKSVLAYLISFKELPTWIDDIQALSNKTISKIENTENALILIDDSQSHLYIHTTNRKLEEIIKSVVYEDIDERKVDIKKIYHALTETDLNIKMLGIHNTFGAGGTAAEAKSYSGKDARLSLTPSFDSGYSFSYCLGAQTNEFGDSKVFGCSASRRKFWGTWTDGIISFSNQCKNIEDALTADNSGEFIKTLVSPIEVENPELLEPLSFYLDYIVPRKGIVILEINKKSLTDWYCTILGKNQVSIGDNINSITLDIEEISNSSIKISYADQNKKASVIIAEDGAPFEKKKRFDLVDFLKSEESFTIIFEEGVAFRENSFWKDNRLQTTFTKDIYHDISWDMIDIRKEDSPSDLKGHISIATRTEEYLTEQILNYKIIAIIKDGGANEISDHLVICEDKIMLIHEKYSSSENVGLRIDDLQVVSSQLIKNIKYLFPGAHSARAERLLKNAVYLNPACKTEKDLIASITSALTNMDAQNECWIVQPGISKEKLINAPQNKAHILLSHLSSICSSNNTIFKLFCSK